MTTVGSQIRMLAPLLLVGGITVAQARGSSDKYNEFAGLGVWPTAPHFVTRGAECEGLRSRLEEIRTKIISAHEECLAEKDSAGLSFAVPRDGSSRCTNPACQILHNRMLRMADHLNAEVGKCRISLAKYEAEKKATVRQAPKPTQSAGTRTLGGAARDFLIGVGCSNLPMGTCEMLDADNARNILRTHRSVLSSKFCGSANFNVARQLLESGMADQPNECGELLRLSH